LGQHQELVTEVEVFEEKISTGFHNGCDQAQQKGQPAKHAQHHPRKSAGSRSIFEANGIIANDKQTFGLPLSLVGPQPQSCDCTSILRSL
jgi:hypothetical protein